MVIIMVGGFMDKNKKNDEKEKKLIYALENFSFKKVFKYNFIIFISIFLLIGVASYFILSKQGSMLAGGSRYSQLSSSYSSGERFSLIKKIKIFFSEDKDLGLAKNNTKSNEEEDIDMSDSSEVADNASAGSSSTSSNKSGYNSTSNRYANTNGYSYASNSNVSNISRLSSELSSINSIGGSGGSSTSLQSFDSNSKARVGVRSANGQKVTAALPRGKSEGSAMELLKNTYKATLYAARDASNDTARSWTGKAFDLTPTVQDTIEYSEEMRAKLDKINPNSIPAFLRDPSLDVDSIRTLKDSAVPGLSSDEDSIGKGLEDINDAKKDFENSNKNKKDFLNNLASINPMYNLSSDDSTEEEIDNESYRVNPTTPKTATSPEGKVITPASSEPEIGEETSVLSTDEYGYIRLTDDSGNVQIFDPDSGKIVGCEDPAAGMCLMPGADGCPADMYFV